MNSRLVILFCLLVCGAWSASAHSQRTILLSDERLFIIESPTNLPADSRSTDGDTFISSAHNVVTNVTAVPAIGAALILIAVIGLFNRSSFLQPSRPPGPTIFFKVLFQSIISPNAP